MPSADVSVLILSDFGKFGNDKARTMVWNKFVENLFKHQAPIVSLSPASDSLLDQTSCRKIRPVHLGDHCAMPRYPGATGFQLSTRHHCEITSILGYLSALPVVFCSLLRPLRRGLRWGDSDLEGMIWNHQYLQKVSIGKRISPDANTDYLRIYQEALAGKEEAKSFWNISEQHHKGTFTGLRQLQAVSKAALEKGDVSPETREYVQNLAGAVWQKGQSRRDQSLCLQGATLLALMPDVAWDSELRPDLHSLFGAVHREAISKGQWPEQISANIDRAQLAYVVNEIGVQQEQNWLLIQTGPQGRLQLLKQREKEISHETPIYLISAPYGQPLSISVSGGTKQYLIDDDAEIIPPISGYRYAGNFIGIRFLNSDRKLSQGMSMAEESVHSYTLQIDSMLESIRLDFHHRNGWKKRIWREQLELIVESISEDESQHEWQWLPGEWDNDGILLKRGVWYPYVRPEDMPSSLSKGKSGHDRYGFYFDMEIKGITQRFRWIEPGTFLMGSPNDEPERRENEIQHEVTLSKGFWLADTTVTQALWQAVMRVNPSKFKDSLENPVERVSWEESMRFIDAFNKLISGAEAQLPSEAQWEYACRAGTTTPFSFGDNISPDQVNYAGRFPYAGGEKGLSRGQTVPVKDLPCNQWGLYQMHGNVWEWCNDRYGEYPDEPIVDPQGSSAGADRVVRGGSWDDFGGFVRSAIRDWLRPDNRLSGLGLRLALGHSELKQVKSGREQASSQTSRSEGRTEGMSG